MTKEETRSLAPQSGVTAEQSLTQQLRQLVLEAMDNLLENSYLYECFDEDLEQAAIAMCDGFEPLEGRDPCDVHELFPFIFEWRELNQHLRGAGCEKG